MLWHTSSAASLASGSSAPTTCNIIFRVPRSADLKKEAPFSGIRGTVTSRVWFEGSVATWYVLCPKIESLPSLGSQSLTLRCSTGSEVASMGNENVCHHLGLKVFFWVAVDCIFVPNLRAPTHVGLSGGRGVDPPNSNRWLRSDQSFLLRLQRLFYCCLLLPNRLPTHGQPISQAFTALPLQHA